MFAREAKQRRKNEPVDSILFKKRNKRQTIGMQQWRAEMNEQSESAQRQRQRQGNRRQEKIRTWNQTWAAEAEEAASGQRKERNAVVRWPAGSER